MKFAVGAWLAAAGLIGLSPAHAETCTAQVQSYKVAAGDTLPAIAEKVYDDAGAWHLISDYPGNAGIVGRNPASLNPGTTIQLPPCPTTALPASTALPQDGLDVASLALDSLIPTPIYIAARKNHAPFASPDWPQGGMATMIVRAAFDAVGLGDRIRIHHIGDANAQFKYLLPTGRYKLGLGWNMPDMGYWKQCSALPQDMQVRCGYKASDPIVPMSFSFFYEIGRADLQNATYEQIKAGRLCRPASWSTFQLVENDIPLTNLTRAANMQDCFRLLLEGNVDFVVGSRLSAIASATKMGILDKVDMASFTGVSFGYELIAHNDNIDGAFDYLEAFNKGLQIIIDNGVYGQITSYYNDEFSRRLQN